MTKIFPISLCFILFSCSQNIDRKIAGNQIHIHDFLKTSEDVLATVESAQFNSKVCTDYLGKLEHSLDNLDLTTLNTAQLINEASRIADNSWRIRVSLHSRLNSVDKECAYQIQATFKQLRFIEDFLMELASRTEHRSPAEIDFMKQPVPMLENAPFYVTRTTSDLPIKFEDGDILVTRGISFLSSMIARLGTRATQFSHIVLIHENQSLKRMQTIESYVGVGVQFYELDYALKNTNARILWLRSKDRARGTKASQAMGNKVRKSMEVGRPIKYDYKLNFDDNTTMSCAEVSQVAFKMVDPSFIIPFYPNEINGAQSLVQRLNIAKGSTYEPGDMEIDPRFKLMGEFQDLRLTRDSRHKDAVMSSIFKWMNEKDYKLHDSKKSKLAGGLIHKIRKTFVWPLFQNIFKIEDFSKEIPGNMLSTITLLNQVGGILLDVVKQKDLEFESRYGIPMTSLDMERALEEFRKQDLDLYGQKKLRKKAMLHPLFRSN